MNNKCPACSTMIKAHEIACKKHWFTVPRELRDRIWRLYRNKRTKGSLEHRRAVFEAIRFLSPDPVQIRVPGTER